MEANYLIIPDIHGQIKQFDAVVIMIKEMIKKDKNIHIVFLGDYIDRGDGGNFKYYDKRFKKEVEIYFEDIGSRLVIEKLFILKQFLEDNNIRHTLLRGNHEDTFIEHIKDIEKGNNIVSLLERRMTKDTRKTYKEYINTLKGFTYDVKLMIKTKTFFDSLPYYLEDKENKLFFVHAGVNPNYALTQNPLENYLWIRRKFFMYTGQYSSKIIFGHTPIDSLDEEEKLFLNVKEPQNIILKEDRIGLDSGNYRHHPLNILRIKNKKYTLYKIDTKGQVEEALGLEV